MSQGEINAENSFFSVAIALPGISPGSQPGDAPSRSLDDLLSAQAGATTRVNNNLEVLNLSVDVARVPIPTDHPLWQVAKGQVFLSEKDGEIFAAPGKITVCSNSAGDCTISYTVTVGKVINLTRAAAQLAGMGFDEQMLQLAEMVRVAPKISATNEAGRIILRAH